MHTRRKATPSDRLFLRDLARRWSNQIGFVPLAGIDDYVAAGWVTVACENGSPAGYLLGRPSMRYDRSICPITQAAVAMDAQRRHHGLALVDDLARTAVARGQAILQCWCRKDLEANTFWQAAHFVHVATRSPDNARGQPLLLWRRPLLPNTPPRFWSLPPVAGHKAEIVTAVRRATRPQPSDG